MFGRLVVAREAGRRLGHELAAQPRPVVTLRWLDDVASVRDGPFLSVWPQNSAQPTLLALLQQVGSFDRVQRSLKDRMVVFHFRPQGAGLARLSTLGDCTLCGQVEAPRHWWRLGAAVISHQGLLSSLEFSRPPKAHLRPTGGHTCGGTRRYVARASRSSRQPGRTRVRIMMLPNKGMQQTKPEPNGASQLIPSVLLLFGWRRSGSRPGRGRGAQVRDRTHRLRRPPWLRRGRSPATEAGSSSVHGCCPCGPFPAADPP